MATMPSSSPEIGPRSRSSSTPAVRAASRALGEIGSQPPNTRSSSDGERHEVPDQRVAILLALAEADVGHLGERADGNGVPGPGGEHAGDEGGGDGAHAGGEDPEAAGGGSDGDGLGHVHQRT